MGVIVGVNIVSVSWCFIEATELNEKEADEPRPTFFNLLLVLLVLLLFTEEGKFEVEFDEVEVEVEEEEEEKVVEEVCCSLLNELFARL